MSVTAISMFVTYHNGNRTVNLNNADFVNVNEDSNEISVILAGYDKAIVIARYASYAEAKTRYDHMLSYLLACARYYDIDCTMED